ncbi:hypothetical protein LO762_00775 [Actinocorallia sp. API 0066]|uniref:divisome protein SepX/GlpR n=1 Tax=Actinocorallia sp. API 0066 TaxID=2896846 RepID=UPI001E584475|nr:hypothetical protein [Actinocorallia sp. API 0066]MCD0447735.1 hypothetical protein [Actinocorallia sp. API 0066]
MSSTLLYLAIVAVWAVVLVPMWLHRDSDTPSGFTRLLARRPAAEYDDYTFDDAETVAAPTEEIEDEVEVEDDDLDVPEPVRAPVRQPLTAGHRRARRSAVMARRRRNTTTLTLVAAVSAFASAFTAAPWWITVPPVLLLLAHFALLRAASRIDASRTAARRAAEAAARRAAVPPPAPAPIAEILPFTTRPEPVVARDEVFDQYADQPRAVND